MSSAHYRLATAAFLLFACAARAAAAEASLEEARNLYAAASFESALAVFGELEARDGASQDALEYKGLCLIALGRLAEARAVADEIIRTTPTFLPVDDDVSPRFVALLNDSRRRLLPEITKQLFNMARDQFRSRDHAAARRNFGEVLRLADDVVWEDNTGAEDLRILASGFLELMNAAAQPEDVRASTAPSMPSSVPAAVVAPPSSPRQRVVLQPPVAIAQEFPRWRPADPLTAQRRFTGAVRVRIDKEGRVAAATIEVTTVPRYYEQVLEAARSWRYTPAHRDGDPIETEKLVRYSLRAN